MEVIDNTIVEPLESIFDRMGMMEGAAAPAKRAMVGAAIGGAIVYLFEDDFTVTSGGAWKPWAFTATKSEEDTSTYFPYWLVIALPTLVAGVLI